MRLIALIAAVLLDVSQGLRDPVRPNPPGTGVIAGRVESAGIAPRPIGGAVVTIKSAELARDISVVTDDAGRFAVPKLPAGRYSIAATKAAYLPGAFGARRPGRAGTVLSLA